MIAPENTVTTTEQATLRQALIWVAYGYPPVTPAYEALIGCYPRSVGRIGSHLIHLDDNDRARLEAGRRRLCSRLMSGDLVARGRRSILDPARLDSVALEPDVPRLRGWDVLDHEDEPTDIPAADWHPHYVDWTPCRISRPPADPARPKRDYLDYVDVQVVTEELFRVFPPVEEDVPEPPRAMHSERAVGHPVQHDPVEFNRLLALDLETNGLPDKQAELVERMQQLVDIVYGEDAAPRETWIKKQVSELHKVRGTFESARQQVEGKQE